MIIQEDGSMTVHINKGNENKYWIVILLGALTAIGPISMDMYLPALPIVAEEIGRAHV